MVKKNNHGRFPALASVQWFHGAYSLSRVEAGAGGRGRPAGDSGFSQPRAASLGSHAGFDRQTHDGLDFGRNVGVVVETVKGSAPTP